MAACQADASVPALPEFRGRPGPHLLCSGLTPGLHLGSLLAGSGGPEVVLGASAQVGRLPGKSLPCLALSHSLCGHTAVASSTGPSGPSPRQL